MNSLEPFIRHELENQPGTAAAPQTPGSHIGLVAKPCRHRKNFFLRGRADLPLCRLAAAEVQRHIVESGIWQGETSCGKCLEYL